MISLHARSATRLLMGVLLLGSSLYAAAATAPSPESDPASSRSESAATLEEGAGGASTPITTADSSAETPSASETPPPSSGELLSPSPAKRTFYEDVVVRGELPSEHVTIKQPQSIGIVDRQDLQRSDGLFLEEALNLVPGVRAETRTVSGGQRITIRGYGNST